MGGCASKPKDADLKPTQAVPTESPVATPDENKSPQVEIISHGNENGGESHEDNVAPLLDLSEPKQEEDKESKLPVEENEESPVSAQVADLLTAPLKQESVESVAKESEDKAAETTVEADQTKPAVAVAVAVAVKSDVVSPTESEDHKNTSTAPLVAVVA